MKVLVGSLNPVKIEAVREAFGKHFSPVEAIGFAAESGVPAQPIGLETFDGAKNRARALKRESESSGLNADFFVGAEGGIMQLYGRWFSFGCMCVIDARGKEGFGVSPLFELPGPIVRKLQAGMELGDVMDEITDEHNTKQKGGAIAFLTKGAMDRKQLYTHGLTVALVPFLHEKMYFGGSDAGTEE